MASDDVTACPGCHKATPTVNGRCRDCWYPKNPSRVPEPPRYRPYLFDLDWDDLVGGWIWWLPAPAGLVTLLVGVVAGSTLLVAIGAGVAALVLLSALLR